VHGPHLEVECECESTVVRPDEDWRQLEPAGLMPWGPLPARHARREQRQAGAARLRKPIPGRLPLMSISLPLGARELP